VNNSGILINSARTREWPDPRQWLAHHFRRIHQILALMRVSTESWQRRFKMKATTFYQNSPPSQVFMGLPTSSGTVSGPETEYIGLVSFAHGLMKSRMSRPPSYITCAWSDTQKNITDAFIQGDDRTCSTKICLSKYMLYPYALLLVKCPDLHAYE
jgi:hypothetical protein